MSSSCKRTVEPEPAIENGTLSLHIHTLSDTTEFLPGDTVADANGRKYVYSTAEYYLSGITLIKMDGTPVSVSNVNLLIHPEEEDYLVGSVPAGNYKTIAFNIGISAAQNHLDPSSFAANNPLSPQTPSMHFATNPEGYIFMNVSGVLDSTSAMNGVPDYSFNYQVGIDSLVKHKQMPDLPFTILPNQTEFIHMYADFSKLFQGVNVKTENSGSKGDVVSQKIAHNIHNIFIYE
ncbi:MAG: MbnP family protein [Cytophagaceae bacterium]